MADTSIRDLHELALHFNPRGISGEEITIQIIQRREAKREASDAVHEKNEIQSEFRRASILIKKHSFTAVREALTKIVLAFHGGLQDTHNVIVLEMLVLKKKLEKALYFFEKHGQELDEKQLVRYLDFLRDIKNTLSQMQTYINDLQGALRGRGTGVFEKIERDLERYELKAFSLARIFGLEWFNERSIAKALFKVEGKIEHIEEMRKRKTSDIDDLLKLEKEYSFDFKKLMTDMFIFTYILVRYGTKTSNEVADAVSEGRLDLPASYEPEFADPISKLLVTERKVLDSIQHSINYLYGETEKAEKLVDKVTVKKKEALRAAV